MQSMLSWARASGTNSWTALAIDAAIKATVILLLAAVIAGLLRKASAAVRHRLWCLTFVGLLLLPLLSYTLPAWQIPVLPPVEEPELAAVELADKPLTVVVEPAVDSAGVSNAPGIELALNDPTDWPNELSMSLPPTDGVPLWTLEPGELALQSPVNDGNATEKSAETPRSRAWSLQFLTLWVAGSLLVIAPLIVGVLHSLWLGLRAAQVTDAGWTGLLQELSGRLQLRRRVRLLELRRSVIPMTWGVLRPVVVVPETAQNWPERLRRFVLLHELAHVKRWDVPFQLLGRAACAMYWFHPLAWYALRQLRVERELACDDCVVTTGERPSDYAEQLVQIARSCRPAGLASVGVAMARNSHLEGRIRAMFDKARSHVPLSARGARVLTIATALLVTTVAVVRPSNRQPATPVLEEAAATEFVTTASEQVTTDLATAPDAVLEPATDAAADKKTIRGTVRDPAGKPLAGATVRAQTPLWEMLKPLVPDGWEPPVIETKSAANGAFEISFATQPLGDLSHLNTQWAEIWKKTVIAASAPAFGPAWVEYEAIERPDQPITLKLVEDLPVQGRIVNLEGEPLPGETIKIGGLSAAENEDLSAWLEAITAGEPPWTAWKQTPRSIDPALVGIPDTVVSDQDGRFELRGLGRERHFTLRFESEKVAHKSVKVATRQMEPQVAALSTHPFESYEPVFGARFTFAATPARTVTGTVRDARTGEPMAGVSVDSYSLADRPRHANNRVLKTVTDQNGRFRITGMPKGDGNRLLALPNDDQPYFMREFEIPNPTGLEPVDVTIDLHRGIWISGRVTDAVTGEPVHARVHYLPYLTNTFAQEVPEFDDNGNVHGDQLRYQTKPDGTYRLVGLPGPAVIGADSVLKAYPMGQGYTGIPGPKESNGQYISTYRNPVYPMSKWPTAMTYIDPPADASDAAVDFEFQSGSSVAFRLVDPDERPLSGVEVTGRLPRYDPATALESAEFEAINFGQDEERTMLFRHKERNLGWVQRIKTDDAGPQPVVIKLQPVTTVTGRVLTKFGDAVSGMVLRADPLPSGDFGQELERVTTDAEGRFTHELLPGASYSLLGEGGGVRFVVIAKELAIEPGQTIDLGDLRIDDDGKVMEKPAR